MTARRLIPLVAALLALVVGGLVWRWQPDRTVVRQFHALCKATAGHNFSGMEELISPEYADRWGMDRTTVLRESRQILGQFFTLSVTPGDLLLIPAGSSPERTIQARIRLGGTGTGIAELAKSEVNRLDTAWVFTWRRADWRPWSWRLVRLDNPGIDLSRRYEW